jgi:hypothetical protein
MRHLISKEELRQERTSESIARTGTASNASSKVCKRNDDGTITIQLPSGKTRVSYQFARDLVIGLIDVL